MKREVVHARPKNPDVMKTRILTLCNEKLNPSKGHCGMPNVESDEWKATVNCKKCLSIQEKTK